MGQIHFSGSAGNYVLQISLPAGTTTFPRSGATGLVAFYNSSDSTKEWSAGTTAQPGRGTVTLTGAKGTVSATLGYTPPPDVKSVLGPVTISGQFACP